VVIHRRANSNKRVVYIAVANKSHKYRYGRSRILYIGSTKKGSSRVAASAAAKARELLSEHGVKTLEFYTVRCPGRQHVKTWMKLERGLLLIFRERFGDVPTANTHGKRAKWKDELSFFTRRRLVSVVEKYS
jgi:predicted GIY-YIG superfamily endonuclease